MISAEAPILFAKACEMFIIELTIRAWVHTEESKRRTLQVCIWLYLKYLQFYREMILPLQFQKLIYLISSLI